MSKFRIFSLYIIALSLIFSTGSFVIAQEESSLPTSTETTSNENARRNSEDAQARKEERRAEITERLDEAKKERIAQRCEQAQVKIGDRITKSLEVQSNRQAVYQRIINKLQELKGRLDSSDVDTSSFEAGLSEVDNSVGLFIVNYEYYMLALGDLQSIDCAEDPEGFWLALQDARALSFEIREDSKSIQRSFTRSVKSIVRNIKVELEMKEDETEQSSGDENTEETSEE